MMGDMEKNMTAKEIVECAGGLCLEEQRELVKEIATEILFDELRERYFFQDQVITSFKAILEEHEEKF